MKKAFPILLRKVSLLLLLASPVQALNLTGFWAGSGGYKIPRQQFYPGSASSNTLTRNWDGHTAKIFGGKNETQGFCLYLLNGSGSDATNVSVSISSFTGPSGSGIVSVAVSSSNVWDTSTRPIQVFLPGYVFEHGISQLGYEEYEERQLPPGIRVPCTVNGNNDCIPNGGTLYTDRPQHDMAFPDPLVPMEEFQISSFTVAASSSQAVWFDVYAATGLNSTNNGISSIYTAQITVMEGVSVSTTIPVSFQLYNFTLPDKPSLPVIIDYSQYDINYRHENQHFPDVSCTTCSVTRQHYAQMFHAHKFAATIGDDQVSADTPRTEDVAKLNGSLYTATSGYANAPGVGVGDQYYSIGTYGSWQGPPWSTTSTVVFCQHVANWGAYFKTNFPATRSFVYLSDEPSTTTLVNNTETWATWMATTTACQTAGYTVARWVTNPWPTVQTLAPYINNPVAGSMLGVSSSTWQTAYLNFATSGSTQAWDYNYPIPGGPHGFDIAEDGTSPTEMIWADKKKGVQGRFLWEGTYFTDPNDSHRDNDLYNDSLTFGYFTSTDNVKGRTGFQYNNDDGVLVYPGHDVIKTPDYGFDGPVASWRLKMYRRGIQDADYITLANAINPSSTTVIVQSLVPTVLWDVQCFTLVDCTYAYGDRGWSNDANAFEVQREALAQIIATAQSAPAYRAQISGPVTIKGKVTIQ